MKSLLDLAIIIAVEAHTNQVDKNGAPYILHPLRVMLAGEIEAERIVGVLHDVAEDCPAWPLERLAEYFPDRIIGALEAVTKRPGEDYMAFCRRAGANPLARRVKIADLRDNLSPDRAPLVTAENQARIDRYRAALDMLVAMDPRTPVEQISEKVDRSTI